MIYTLSGKTPVLHGDVFIAPGAHVIGAVDIGASASVWFNVVIRADDDRITIGEETNIQDGSVLHVDAGSPMRIGRGVVVGHKVMLHGCTIGDGSLIGINAVVLNGAKIGNHCLIGANSLIPENAVIPDGSLVLGTPGKVVRQLSEKEIAKIAMGAKQYCARAREYKSQLVAGTT
ncbi:MAG: gamma carbonic anhydrase family protein [Porticoccaceae bacterium]|nr:gamma carbonic anhydrase family protein [Porticoccaceae bacterium]